MSRVNEGQFLFTFFVFRDFFVVFCALRARLGQVIFNVLPPARL